MIEEEKHPDGYYINEHSNPATLITYYDNGGEEEVVIEQWDRLQVENRVKLDRDAIVALETILTERAL